MDPAADDSQPSPIQNTPTSTNENLGSRNEATVDAENHKIQLSGCSLYKQQMEDTSDSVPNKDQLIFLEIPANALTRCSCLCHDQVLRLKASVADSGCSCKGNLDISVVRRNDAILLALKAVGSSFQELAGNWRYIVNSVDVTQNSIESRSWPEEVKLTDLTDINGMSTQTVDSHQNKAGGDTSPGIGPKNSGCDVGDISVCSDVSKQQTETGLKEDISLDRTDSKITEYVSPVDAPPIRRRGRPRKIARHDDIDETSIKKELEEVDTKISVKPSRNCCSCCGRVFRLQITQKQHEIKCHLNVTNGSIVTCKRCKNSFVSLDQYELHLEQCYLENVNATNDYLKLKLKSGDQQVCDVCFSIFQTRSRMLKHKHRIHLGQVQDAQEVTKPERYYPCKFCDQVFGNGSSRHRHQKFYCPRNPDCKRPHCCNQCGNFFTCDEDLREHKQRRHKNTLPYVCHLCGTELTSRSSIYFHNLKRHSGKPPKFKCTHCDKAFYTRNKLEKHLTSHSSDRNIQCELCGKQFKTPQHVAQHKKTIHENRYRYRCEKCGHGMEKLQYLQSHKCGRVRRIQENEKSIPPVSVDEMESTQKDVTLIIAASPSETIQESVPVTTGLFGSQENAITSHYLLPDINLITNYQTHGEPGVDPVTPSLAIPVSVSEQPYILQPSSPTYTQFMMPDNVRY